MITEAQQDLASLYVLGALPESERQLFQTELGSNRELRELVQSLEHASDALALSVPRMEPSRALKARILEQIEATTEAAVEAGAHQTRPQIPAGFHFLMGNQTSGWKQLPVPGAYIKLLSLHRDRGYAVLMGKLDPGVRYPAHSHAGPEDLFILTGDLHIGDTELRAGDFHRADAGSSHGVNFSVRGCTLIAVLTLDNPLVAFASG